jgi:cytochrome c oxidase assembly protein Cox11
MPVFFVVSPDTSTPGREIVVDYQFYPLDKFPGAGH